MPASALWILILSLIIIALAMAQARILTLKGRAVPDSRERYTLSTWFIAITGTIIAICILCVVVLLQHDLHLFAGIIGFVTLCQTFGLGSHFDDDNWFNGQWTKLKKGFKSIATPPQSTAGSIAG